MAETEANVACCGVVDVADGAREEASPEDADPATDGDDAVSAVVPADAMALMGAAAAVRRAEKGGSKIVD